MQIPIVVVGVIRIVEVTKTKTATSIFKAQATRKKCCQIKAGNRPALP